MSAEEDARQLLGVVWSRGAKSPPIPVDPVQIARRLGLQVFVSPMDSKVSGALMSKPGQDALIYLNNKDSTNRQRFTCAHELGHYVKRTNEGTFEFEYVDLRGPLATQGVSADEIYANQFAATLLMPADAVRRFHKDGLDVIDLAYKFGVSAEAMTFRLANVRVR